MGLARGIWRFKITGLEHVPAEGPVILAGNHVSNLDGPLLAMAAVPTRYLRGLGKKELFNIPVLAWFLRNNGYVPLDRSGDIGAMRWAVALLKSGGCMQIFPEGTRSKDGRPGSPKAGLGFMAGRTGAQVVPARVINTNRFLSLARLEVRFGPAMRFEGDPGDREACVAFGRAVMDRIFSL
jgi:1-acyl-sn-glycerol-3-phosphate acyltransferase